MGHARALLTLDNPTMQIRLFEELMREGYSVRKVEQMVKALNDGESVKGTSGKKIAPAKLPEEYDLLKKQLSTFFQSKVQLSCSGKGKGKISIPFNSEEELERIVGILDKLK